MTETDPQDDLSVAVAPPSAQLPEDAPWKGFDMVVMLFFIYGFWPALASEVLFRSGFFSAFYGPEAVELVRSQTAAGADGAILQTRFGLWLFVVAFPFQVATILLIPYFLSRVSPSQLGLKLEGSGRALRYAINVWSIVTPLVLGLHLLVIWVMRQTLHAEPQVHALVQVASQSLHPAEWALLIGVAIAVAPVIEELLFRGILQPWVRTRPWSAPLVLVVAWVVAILHRGERINAIDWASTANILDAFAPLLFVLLISLLYYKVRNHPETAAQVVVALLFACVHSDWPSPVGLFVLGFVLGRLMDQTRNLLAPILVHSLFNAVSCVMLFVG